MQSCPKSFKTKLHRIFSDAMLSVNFQATLRRVLTCVLFLQVYQGKIAQDFFMQCCLEPLGQHCIRF